MDDKETPLKSRNQLVNEGIQANREARDGFPRLESDPAVYFEKAQAAKDNLIQTLEDHWTDESPNYRSYSVSGFHSKLDTYDIRVNDNGEFGLTVDIKETSKGWPAEVTEIRAVWDSHGVIYKETHSMTGSTVKGGDTASFTPQKVNKPEFGLLKLGSAKRIIEESLGSSTTQRTT